MITHPRWFAAFLLTLATLMVLACVHARADQAINPTRVPCAVVRASINLVGLDAAIQEALTRGYSQDQIDSVIARCRLRAK